MGIENISKITLGDMLLIYERDSETNVCGFVIIPKEMEKKITKDKFCRINSLVQLKIIGDKYPNCYAHGSSMRNSESSNRMKYEKQEIINENNKIYIKTYLKDDRGYEAIHLVTYYNNEKSFEVKTIYNNNSNESVILEMISSFEIGSITPFQPKDAPNSLLVHRLRSKWSHEARLHTETIEDLQLEPSWSNWAVSCERFGQIGSMPVKKFAPFLAIEDKKSDVLWGVQLAHEASWQMEIYRQDDALHISGGLADREFGHWMKNLNPGESFETPYAIISTCKGGGIDNISQRITSSGNKYFINFPKEEENLPIIFNEYCTTWGCPSHNNINKIIEKIKDKGIDYFVIDCGWFKEGEKPWHISMGDYEISKELFEDGLDKTVNLIKKSGMKPGIWFEIDNVGEASKAYNLEEHLLKRDGKVITTYSRRFWDMRDPWVINYLENKVIKLLKDYKFEYIKMDYNDTIGIGVDGAESLGEGLRENMNSSVKFIKKIIKDIPGIVLENCASGGHKLEPLMMSLTSMASFSDAHECEEIPIIAANLHRLILPRQSQIWAVIRKDDSLKRIAYSIINTFLGRMCLSGDVIELNKEQWNLIDEGIDFYKSISHIIRDGYSYRYGTKIKSERNPEGWQGVLRLTENREALIIIHRFYGNYDNEIKIELPKNCPKNIVRVYSDSKNLDIKILNNELIYKSNEEMKAIAIFLK